MRLIDDNLAEVVSRLGPDDQADSLAFLHGPDLMRMGDARGPAQERARWDQGVGKVLAGKDHLSSATSSLQLDRAGKIALVLMQAKRGLTVLAVPDQEKILGLVPSARAPAGFDDGAQESVQGMSNPVIQLLVPCPEPQLVAGHVVPGERLP